MQKYLTLLSYTTYDTFYGTTSYHLETRHHHKLLTVLGWQRALRKEGIKDAHVIDITTKSCIRPGS